MIEKTKRRKDEKTKRRKDESNYQHKTKCVGDTACPLSHNTPQPLGNTQQLLQRRQMFFGCPVFEHGQVVAEHDVEVVVFAYLDNLEIMYSKAVCLRTSNNAHYFSFISTVKVVHHNLDLAIQCTGNGIRVGNKVRFREVLLVLVGKGECHSYLAFVGCCVRMHNVRGLRQLTALHRP